MRFVYFKSGFRKPESVSVTCEDFQSSWLIQILELNYWQILKAEYLSLRIVIPIIHMPLPHFTVVYPTETFSE